MILNGKKCQSPFRPTSSYLSLTSSERRDRFPGDESRFPFTRCLCFHSALCASVCACVCLSESLPAVSALPSFLLSFLFFPTMPCLESLYKRKNKLYLYTLACANTLEGWCFELLLWMLCFYFLTEWLDLGWCDILWCSVLYVVMFGAISVVLCEVIALFLKIPQESLFVVFSLFLIL